MKIVIASNEHSVEAEVPDDAPGLDVNEFMAMTRDLYRETCKPQAPQMGFNSPRGKRDG